MSRASCVAIACAIAAWSCGVKRPPYGGERESALVAATAARDVATVRQLLASGADPNKMVRFEGLNRSPWELALRQIRPGNAASIEIVQAMLAGGADPESAWGEHVARGITRQREEPPIQLAMLHPDPVVVRALVEAHLNPQHAQNALVMAVETGEAGIVHILVEAGTDVNCRPGANTPLVAAIEARNVALMTYLEEHGAREKP